MPFACPNCQFDNPDGARFCFNCAFPLDPTAPVPTAEPPTAMLPATSPLPTRSPRRALPWVIAAIAAAVVVVVAVVVLASGGSDSATTDGTSSTAVGATLAGASTSVDVSSTTSGAVTSTGAGPASPTTATTAPVAYVQEPVVGPLHLGHSGPRVKALQTRLNALGYRQGAPDGKFGPVTDVSLRKFQGDNHLTVDGSAGAATFKALKIPYLEAVAVSQIIANASSTNPPDGSVTYDVGNLLDGNVDTSWQSNASDTPEGVTITFTFATPIDLKQLSIANGYEVVKGNRNTYFTKNSRVKELKVTSGAQEITVELADDMKPQPVDVAFGKIDTLTLAVVSRYPGDAYTEVAITDIVFLVDSAG